VRDDRQASLAPSVGADAQVISLEAAPGSSRQARQFASEFTVQCGFSDIVEEVSLCTTELVTNALLHTRHPFVVTVRPLQFGIRLDVLDLDPDHLPVAIPTAGSAVDLTTFGNSGRGLQIVAAVAERWGMFTTDEGKTVWAEVTSTYPSSPAEPIVSLGRTPPRHNDLLTLHYLDIPVRAAVSSGIQVEDLLRDIQLEGQALDHHEEVGRLFALLDRTASVRLGGRHAALRAAAQGMTRFDLVTNASADALAALEDLASLLRDVSDLLSIPVPPPGTDVVAFREWLNAESTRQLNGAPPTICHLTV
jgi:anti-sigma regulatory factor (Ser/Thr protein kinase)